MNYDYRKLKGKIKEKYETQAEFSKALCIGESTLNLKLNNKTEWSQEEMVKALDLLGESKSKLKEYFFTHKV